MLNKTELENKHNWTAMNYRVHVLELEKENARLRAWLDEYEKMFGGLDIGKVVK